MKEKKYISTTELADILGISRVAVYKKIKKGEIEAIRIGKNYAIPFSSITGNNLTSKEKDIIIKAVKKTVNEYGEVLKLLQNE